MTRAWFEKRAIRKAEQRLGVARGWWGTYADVHGPAGERVRRSGWVWIVSQDGVVVSRHESRRYAIAKARAAGLASTKRRRR